MPFFLCHFFCAIFFVSFFLCHHFCVIVFNLEVGHFLSVYFFSMPYLDRALGLRPNSKSWHRKKPPSLFSDFNVIIVALVASLWWVSPSQGSSVDPACPRRGSLAFGGPSADPRARVLLFAAFDPCRLSESEAICAYVVISALPLSAVPKESAPSYCAGPAVPALPSCTVPVGPESPFCVAFKGVFPDIVMAVPFPACCAAILGSAPPFCISPTASGLFTSAISAGTTPPYCAMPAVVSCYAVLFIPVPPSAPVPRPRPRSYSLPRRGRRCCRTQS